MSYYTSQPNYYSNSPKPYLTDDIGAPVPGWGVNLAVVGPARVGVDGFGATYGVDAAGHRTVDVAQLTAKYPQYGKSLISSVPWWGWLAGAVVVGGGIAYATSR